MARTLAMWQHTVPPEERARYLQEIAGRRAAAKAAGSHFWAFQQVAAAGEFLEFVEAGSEDALRATLHVVQPSARAVPMWQEVTGE